MSTICPKCSTYGNYDKKFCENCGEKVVPLPTCNWCDEEMRPRMRHCPECGRSRNEALNTSPPPGLFKRFFNKLFGSDTEETKK